MTFLYAGVNPAIPKFCDAHHVQPRAGESPSGFNPVSDKPTSHPHWFPRNVGPFLRIMH